MKLKGREQSGNIEDRRGTGSRKIIAGGTVGTLAILVIVWLLGGDPTQIVNNLQTSGGGEVTVDSAVIKAEEELAAFTGVVLKT